MPGGAARGTKPPRRHVFSWLTIAGVSLAVALTFILVAAVWADTAAQERVVAGTAKADTIVGTSSHDRIYGRGGNDWLRGLGGNDVLDGGSGKDIVSGALGNDRIVVRDRMQDRVYCGLGKDTVVADARDRIHADCETVSLPGRPGTVPESRTDCATTNHTSWTWEECKPGTTITVTNRAWNCSQPLSTYGPLPIKVISISTEPWDDGTAVTVNSGCVGSPGTDVNLILDIRGDGPRSPNGPGVDAFKTRVNPEELRITGSIQCGRRILDAHQDAIQLQGGTNIAFVNVEAGGDFDAGLSTCHNAGGGPFYSLNEITNVDVLGGRFIGCNKALNGNNAGFGVDIASARFRSGRNDGTDPNCGFASSPPCINTGAMTLRSVTCEQWLEGRWVSVASR